MNLYVPIPLQDSSFSYMGHVPGVGLLGQMSVLLSSSEEMNTQSAAVGMPAYTPCKQYTGTTVSPHSHLCFLFLFFRVAVLVICLYGATKYLTKAV